MSIGAKLKRSFPAQLMLIYLFVGGGLVVNFFQLCCLVIWPFSKRWYRRATTFLAYIFWSGLSWTGQEWSGTTVDCYFNKEDMKYVNKEHVVMLMNHKYDIEWLMGWIICQRVGLLRGSKVISKSSLKFLPLIGWCWYFTESIFINRDWKTDQKILPEGIDKLITDYPEDHFFNILLFAEGTRFTKKKHEASMQIAREKGLPELKHHLLPRTKGLHLMLKGAKGRIGAIYDLNVAIKPNGENGPTFTSIRKGIPLKSEIYVRRIPIAEWPEDEKEFNAFMHKVYQEKDAIFDTFEREGTFASLPGEKVDMPKNYYDCYITFFWINVLIVPLFYWLYTFITTSTLFANLILFVVIGCFSLLSEFFDRVTRADAGSEYGLKTGETKDNKKAN